MAAISKLLMAVLCAAFATQAHAQKYPDHPVKVVVGFAAGGGTDVAGRVIAQKLSDATGQSFVVENRTGASGLIASEQVAKAPADGYTIMVGSQTTLAVAPALYKKFQLDVVKDLTGMAMIGVSPLVAVVNASSPIRSIKDLVAEAKARNGTMNFGSGGVGTTPHMAGELLAFNAGVKLVHVAYRGEAPALNDVLGGQIPFMFSNLSVVKGNIEGGKLRALAVTTTQRVPSLPDVPTLAETFPGFDAATWFVLVAPAGTPREAITRINAETKKIVKTQDFQQRFDQLGMIPDQDRTPDEINAYIKAEIAKWAKVIKDADVKSAD
ncbi:Bug family tripartite tricarboxylate transporter substrate binding protein [Rhodoplanes sp. Z2-YC6860]|uniref:Bug family tripartite tricarboxylate transporter substrate binding protein n=1 Tax=Rhodoplanes sp. Z2-YC6860 TaxID=674703 RepID=UPI00078CAAC1|nr:tripartite tricarboxylate transporter substrate binding protein [Rhodoplanes sp. Z2-YC6860]AMN38563.1 DHA2 family major facilitator superfamily protein [Rhodoplanes sp. Z2-YC6860]